MSIKKLQNNALKNYKPLGEVVFENLRDAILSGELSPGERLMEIQIADMLGVSRTPVREAMKRLEQEDFIEMIPRKGAYVKQVNGGDILDVLEIRKVLEGFAAQRAAERMTSREIDRMNALLAEFDEFAASKDREALIDIDDQFHDLIYGSSDNKKLTEIIDGLHKHYYRFRSVYYNAFDDFEQVVKGHRQILKALIDKDGERAKQLTEAHIDHITETVNEWHCKKDALTGRA